MRTSQTLVLPKGALMQGPAAIWTGHDVRCPYGGMGGHRNYVFVHGNGSGLVESPSAIHAPVLPVGGCCPSGSRRTGQHVPSVQHRFGLEPPAQRIHRFHPNCSTDDS